MSNKIETEELLGPDDYQMALDSQGACNASGLIFSLAKVMQKICNEAHKNGLGTDWKNKHPIVYLYVTQLASLANVDVANFNEYHLATEACIEGAKKPNESATGF